MTQNMLNGLRANQIHWADQADMDKNHSLLSGKHFLGRGIGLRRMSIAWWNIHRPGTYENDIPDEYQNPSTRMFMIDLF